VWMPCAALPVLLCGFGLSQLAGYEKIVGRDDDAVICWDGVPSEHRALIWRSHDMDVEGCKVSLHAAGIVIPDGTTEYGNQPHHHVSRDIGGILPYHDDIGFAGRLLRKDDAAPCQGFCFIDVNETGDPRLIAGCWVHVPTKACFPWNVHVSGQRAGIQKFQREGAGYLTTNHLDRAGYFHSQPYPSALDGKAKVILTGHESGLPFGSDDLQSADLDLAFSKASLPAGDAHQSHCCDTGHDRRSGLNPSWPIKALSVIGIVASRNTVQLNHFPECRTAAFRRLAYHCRALDGAN